MPSRSVVVSVGSDARDVATYPHSGNFSVPLGPSANNAALAPAWPAAPLMRVSGCRVVERSRGGGGQLSIEIPSACDLHVPAASWFQGLVASVAYEGGCRGTAPIFGTVARAYQHPCERNRLCLVVHVDATAGCGTEPEGPADDACEVTLRAERPAVTGPVVGLGPAVDGGGYVRAINIDPRVAPADVVPAPNRPACKLLVAPFDAGAAGGVVCTVTGFACVPCGQTVTTADGCCPACGGSVVDAPACGITASGGPGTWFALAPPGLPAAFAAVPALRFELWVGTSAAAAAALVGAQPSVSFGGAARGFRPTREVLCTIRLRDVYVPCCPRLLSGWRGAIADVPFLYVQVRPPGGVVLSEPLITTTPIDTTNWLTFVVPVHAQHGGRALQVLQGPYDQQQCVCRTPWAELSVRLVGPTGHVIAFCPSLPGAFAEAGPDPLGQVRVTLEATFSEPDPRGALAPVPHRMPFPQ